MEDTVTKVSKADQLVMDPCAATFMIVWAWMELLKRLIFNGCKTDPACIIGPAPAILELIPR